MTMLIPQEVCLNNFEFFDRLEVCWISKTVLFCSLMNLGADSTASNKRERFDNKCLGDDTAIY